MDTLTAIARRYSFRGKYDPAPVPRDDLLKIVQAGYAAPSGCNVQTTSFLVLDAPEIMQQAGALLSAHPGFAGAPAGVLVLTQRLPGNGGRFYNVQDYAAAIENMLLAATDLGYVSCWVEGQITGGSDIGRRLANALGVPAGYEPVCYLPMGRPAPGERTGCTAKKKPLHERVFFNRFGQAE